MDDAEDNERGHVAMARSFRPVTQRKNELQDEESHIDVSYDVIKDRRYLVAKWPAVIIKQGLGCADEVHDDDGGKVV